MTIDPPPHSLGGSIDSTSALPVGSTAQPGDPGKSLARDRAGIIDAAIDRACEVMRIANRVLLTSHRRPDGDGIGSMCGLAALLTGQGKRATIYSVDPLAKRYRWLPLADSAVDAISASERFDCTIVVDCADVSLLGNALPPPSVCGTLITLDHHASGRPFGDIAVWDVEAASVGVLVHRIAQRESWPLTSQAAVSLYVSLISDTGGFRHANTNAEALQVGADLVRAGAMPTVVATELEERPSSGKLRLLGAVLSTLELHCADRVGVLTVTTDMVDAARAKWDDIEGMVNWSRSAAGVEVGVMFAATRGEGIRVSVRSRNSKIDVGRVCMTLGGGGHPGAGGCHLHGDLAAVKDSVVRALGAAFDRARGTLSPRAATDG